MRSTPGRSTGTQPNGGKAAAAGCASKAGSRPGSTAIHRERHHPVPRPVHRRTVRPALRAGHRPGDERLRRLDGSPLGRTDGSRGMAGQGLPAPVPRTGIPTYAVDWQLLELGGAVCKSAPKDGSFRVLDLPPFLAGLMRWAMDNRRDTCCCPLEDDRPTCKGEDETPPNYLFLGPKGGHPRRSNYADGFLTPAAEGLHPARHGLRRPSTSPPSRGPASPSAGATAETGRRPRRRHLAEPDWQTQATRLPAYSRHLAGRRETAQGHPDGPRGHALQGMDRVYIHVTRQMRERLCEVLEELWQDALTERYEIDSTRKSPAGSPAASPRDRPASGIKHSRAKVGPPKSVILPLDLPLAVLSGPPLTSETASDLGAPLRNRTVDLLLTMDHQKVPVSAVEALNRQNASSRWRRRAQISPHRLRFAPQNAPHNDLRFDSSWGRLRGPSTRSILSSSACGLAPVRAENLVHSSDQRGLLSRPSGRDDHRSCACGSCSS